MEVTAKVINENDKFVKENKTKFEKQRDAMQLKHHYEELRNIANAYDKDEVAILCRVFAQKHPELLFEALQEQNRMLTAYVQRINSLYSAINAEEGVL